MLDFFFHTEVGRLLFAMIRSALFVALVAGICYGFIALMRWLKRATGNDWLNRDD